MMRAIRQAWINREARREADAQAVCDRIMSRCSNAQELSVLAYAAGRCANAVQRAHRLSAISAAYQGALH